MSVATSHHEIRCPVYGFITLSPWEMEIISQLPFQRLRRIRQLAWTDLVYPSAMHTRFEHSLGVMHMATQLFEGIVRNSRELLGNVLDLNDTAIARSRQLVRLAALLHDVGHGPFSHATEELFPKRDGAPNGHYKHEDYTFAIIREKFRSAIENNAENEGFKITADEVAEFLEGNLTSRLAFWRDIVSGQMDADRMDYLLRDSHHIGVNYGNYDWRRIANTIEAVPPSDQFGSPKIGVSEGGRHALEELLIARYSMFWQVYFHKTRVIMDFHLQKALREMLPSGTFPSPIGDGIDEYLRWDDWRVLGLLANGEGGDHGRRLVERDHYREVYHTMEVAELIDRSELDKVEEALAEIEPVLIPSGKSWYRVDKGDIPIISENPNKIVSPLTAHSALISKLPSTSLIRIYVKKENKERAREKIQSVTGGEYGA